MTTTKTKRKNQVTLQHIGKPMTHINNDLWHDLSYHASIQAARRAIKMHTAHLDYGSWDDHYRILDADNGVGEEK